MLFLICRGGWYANVVSSLCCIYSKCLRRFFFIWFHFAFDDGGCLRQLFFLAQCGFVGGEMSSSVFLFLLKYGFDGGKAFAGLFL